MASVLDQIRTLLAKAGQGEVEEQRTSAWIAAKLMREHKVELSLPSESVPVMTTPASSASPAANGLCRRCGRNPAFMCQHCADCIVKHATAAAEAKAASARASRPAQSPFAGSRPRKCAGGCGIVRPGDQLNEKGVCWTCVARGETEPPKPPPPRRAPPPPPKAERDSGADDWVDLDRYLDDDDDDDDAERVLGADGRYHKVRRRD